MYLLQMLPEIVRPLPVLVLGSAGAGIATESLPADTVHAAFMPVKIVDRTKPFRAGAFQYIAAVGFGVSLVMLTRRESFSGGCSHGGTA
jgi:hypothetical protein